MHKCIQIPPSPMYDEEGNFVGWKDNTQSHKEQLIAQLEDKYFKREQQIDADYKQKLQNAWLGNFLARTSHELVMQLN